MSSMAKNDPILVDDQSLFFRQIVDSSPALLHTARPDGYLDFFNQTWLRYVGAGRKKTAPKTLGFYENRVSGQPYSDVAST